MAQSGQSRHCNILSVVGVRADIRNVLPLVARANGHDEHVEMLKIDERAPNAGLV
jgi:hypothetical protein